MSTNTRTGTVTLVAVSYYLKCNDKYRLTMSAGGMQTMRAIIEI